MGSVRNCLSVRLSVIWDLRGRERGNVAWERPATELRGVPEDKEEEEKEKSDPHDEEWNALLFPKRE